MATPNSSVAPGRRAAQSSPPAAPRTVPSPSAVRKTATPMMQNLSQTGSIPSPAASHLLSFNTPAGLGFEGATPTSALPAAVAAMAHSMVPTMSELGLTASGARRNEDAERRARMRRVLQTIGRPRGRVGEEGIARVSRRVGLANDMDVTEKLSPGERERKSGNRPITIAGNTVLIEIGLKRHIAQSVSVTHNVQTDTTKRDAEGVGRVLLEDLQPARDGSALNTTLDRFARNLEALARIDRISSSRINCFEALGGLGSCLCRLYDAELRAVLGHDNFGASHNTATARHMIMCKKSGRPAIHAHRKIGLELGYWEQSQPVTEAEPLPSDLAQSSGHKNDFDDDSNTNERTFALRIEIETCPAEVYPPLRVSDSWLPSELGVPDLGSADGIPWQDPPPTFLAAQTGEDAMSVDNEQKLPDLRFVAKLDPPMILPYQNAVQILASVGLPAPSMMAIPPQYAAALVGVETPQIPTSLFSTTSEQEVLSFQGGNECFVRHKYILDTAKPDWSYELAELPFSHPRQLVDILPVLRQWACVATYLQQVCGSEPKFSGPSSSATNGTISKKSTALEEMMIDMSRLTPASGNNVAMNGTQPTGRTDHDRSYEFVTSIHKIQVLFTTDPVPTLGLTFDHAHTSRPAGVDVQILTNAEILVTRHSGIFTDDADNNPATAKKLASALQACGHLCVWIEWMRQLRS